jgi:hypothetical protein
MLLTRSPVEFCGRPGRLFCALILSVGATLCLFAPTASATLGEAAQSIAEDQRVLGGEVQVPARQAQQHEAATPEAYTVEQISTPAGVIVNEYVTPDGTVFAVSWRGPRPPDLSQLLGSYFNEFKSAAAAPGRQQRHLYVKTQGLVVETGGHMRDLHGRAYIPSLLPPNVSTEDIR